MNLAGLPPQISPDGISLDTTLPAPIIAFSPIFTPFSMILLVPMNAYAPIWTGLHCLFSMSV